MQIELPQETESRYHNLARETGKTAEEYLCEAAERYLEEYEVESSADNTLEDRLDAQLIKERLAVWEAQGRPGITLEEYAHSHGLGKTEVDPIARTIFLKE